MPSQVEDVLEQEFLLIRARILEVAAKLDRLDRADGSAPDDPRMKQIKNGLSILQEASGKRAERVQLAFSLNYDQGWRERFFGKEQP